MTIKNIYIMDGEFTLDPHDVSENKHETAWRNYQIVLHPATQTLDEATNKLTILYQSTQCSGEIKDDGSDNVCILGSYSYPSPVDAIEGETETETACYYCGGTGVTLHELLYTRASLDVFVEYEHAEQESYLLRDLYAEALGTDHYGLRTSIHLCHMHDGEISTMDEVLKTFINGMFIINITSLILCNIT